MQFASKIFLFFSVLGFIFSSCKKDENDPALTGTGTLGLEMDHIIGDQSFNLGTWYINPNGDSVKFSTLKYFVSNIKLGKADGSFFTVPKDSCYFLVSQELESSKLLEIKNVPVGDYTNIQFSLGVDSLKSRAPLAERNGALDPTGGMTNGMYWSWNSGYIFFKMEGISPKARLDTAFTKERTFFYHIGFYGYKGADAEFPNIQALNNLKTISLSKSGSTLQVRKDKEVEAHLKLDVAKVWKSSTYNLNVATDPDIMFDDRSLKISGNYSQAFSLDHVHND